MSRLPNIGIAGGALSIAGLIFILPIGSILFGAAILRTRELSEPLGHLLLALAVPWLVMVAHVLLSTPRVPDWLRWLVVSVLALAIGYLLRAEQRDESVVG